ncbi:MAG: tetratricopeptide repeat protein [bacterium]
MHKRKKRKYGIFYTAVEKRIKTYSYLITVFFLFFLLLPVKANSVSVKSREVFNITAGFINYHDGNYTDAINYFKKESGDLLKNRYFNYTLASLYFKGGEYKNSLNYINLALKSKNKKLTKTRIKYLILKAKITANTGNIKKSIGILKSILGKNPYNLKALLFLSNLYIYKKDLKTAASYLNIIKLNRPDNISAYYMLSKIYMAQNKKKKAEQNLIGLISIDPYFKQAYFRLAAIYILAGKEKAAINIFNKYLKINPYSETALYQCAILEYALKNYPASRKYFLNFIGIAKNSKNTLRLKNNAYFFIGISYILQKNYKNGLVYLDKLEPGRHYIDAKLQEIEIYIDNYKKNGNIKYREFIEKTIAKMLSNPKLKRNLKFYYFSAIALSEIKNYRMSEYVIKKGLLKFTNNTALLYELGSAYHALKKEKKAYAVMKRILKINPYDADALNYSGYYLAVKNKDLKKAKIMIKNALSYDKNSPYILDSLGFVYYKEKKYAKALKLFKTALKKLGQSATVLKHIGMDYFMLKNYKKALEYLKKSYKIKKSKEVERYIMKIRKIQSRSHIFSSFR